MLTMSALHTSTSVVTPKLASASFPDFRSRACKTLHRTMFIERNPHAPSSRHRSAIEDEAELRWLLETGLATNRFELRFQPQFSADGTVSGVEASPRFLHPTIGMMSPSMFLPVAERYGQIFGIGDWIIQEACRQLQQWRKQGPRNLSIVVHVSPIQFESPDFAEAVLQSLEDNGLSPASLELELPLSILMSDRSDFIAQLATLRHSSVRLALDEYRVGDSLLHSLSQLPIFTLKIRSPFIETIGKLRVLRPNVEVVLKMANALNIQTVVEGVETEEQRAILAELGVERFQGCLFSMPLSSDAIRGLFRESQRELSNLN